MIKLPDLEKAWEDHTEDEQWSYLAMIEKQNKLIRH